MHLAQLNIAEAKNSMESTVMADFVANIDRINLLAESSPGFVWRMTDEDGENSYHMQLFDSEYIVTNMSVWKDRDSLFEFTYRTAHVEIFKRRKEWFNAFKSSHMVMWFIPVGHIPTIEEAKERLEYLNTNGPSPYAFTFKDNYQPQHH